MERNNFMNNEQKAPIPPLTTMTATELLQTQFTPLQFAVDKLLPQGIFIFAGSARLSLDPLKVCLKIANFWEESTSVGEVLYLALEDNYRRLQSRMLEIIEETDNSYEQLHFAIASLGISNGLVEQVNQFMTTYPSTKLIVIDTLEHIRNTTAETSMYSHDYNDIQKIRAITEAHDVTVLLIHHTRKMFDPDPLNTLTGSTGLVGAVDGVWVLEKEKRTENKGKLTIVNRDTGGYCFKVEFNEDDFKWNNLGDYEQATKNEDTFCVLINEFLKENWQGTATELVTELVTETITVSNVTKRLNKRKEQLFTDYRIDYSYQRTGQERIITLVRMSNVTHDTADIDTLSNTQNLI